MSHPFEKYRYPETNSDVLRALLEEFGFELKSNDSENLYLMKNDKNVTVPNEEKIFGLTIYHIADQSGIPDEDFRKKLNELNTTIKPKQ